MASPLMEEPDFKFMEEISDGINVMVCVCNIVWVFAIHNNEWKKR